MWGSKQVVYIIYAGAVYQKVFHVEKQKHDKLNNSNERTRLLTRSTKVNVQCYVFQYTFLNSYSFQIQTEAAPHRQFSDVPFHPVVQVSATVTCTVLPHEFIPEPSTFLFLFFQHHGQIQHEQTVTICHSKSAPHPSVQHCSPFPVSEGEFYSNRPDRYHVVKLCAFTPSSSSFKSTLE